MKAVDDVSFEVYRSETLGIVGESGCGKSTHCAACQKGILSERITHNDPKINNILLDAHTQKGLCMIDLDTVKNGLIHFDYGDCLRSAANPAGEETQNLHHVHFDVHDFEWITRGYLEEVRTFLSEADIAYLADSINVIVLEQTIRFLMDYLNGDIYYTTSYPAHNLNRARVQFVLLQDIERKEAQIRKIIDHLSYPK